VRWAAVAVLLVVACKGPAASPSPTVDGGAAITPPKTSDTASFLSRVPDAPIVMVTLEPLPAAMWQRLLWDLGPIIEELAGVAPSSFGHLAAYLDGDVFVVRAEIAAPAPVEAAVSRAAAKLGAVREGEAWLLDGEQMTAVLVADDLVVISGKAPAVRAALPRVTAPVAKPLDIAAVRALAAEHQLGLAAGWVTPRPLIPELPDGVDPVCAAALKGALEALPRLPLGLTSASDKGVAFKLVLPLPDPVMAELHAIRAPGVTLEARNAPVALAGAMPSGGALRAIWDRCTEQTLRVDSMALVGLELEWSGLLPSLTDGYLVFSGADAASEKRLLELAGGALPGAKVERAGKTVYAATGLGGPKAIKEALGSTSTPPLALFTLDLGVALKKFGAKPDPFDRTGLNDAAARLLGRITFLVEAKPKAVEVQFEVGFAPTQPIPPKVAVTDEVAACMAHLERGWREARKALPVLGLADQEGRIRTQYLTGFEGRLFLEGCVALPAVERDCVVKGEVLEITGSCKTENLKMPPLLSWFDREGKYLEERLHPKVPRVATPIADGTYVAKASEDDEEERLRVSGGQIDLHGERYKLSQEREGRLELTNREGSTTMSFLAAGGGSFYSNPDLQELIFPLAADGSFLLDAGNGYLAGDGASCTAVSEQGALSTPTCTWVNENGKRLLRLSSTSQEYLVVGAHLVSTGARLYVRK
jgi:hypothetical protein